MKELDREQVRLLVESLVLALVEDVDSASVTLVQKPKSTIVLVHVDPKDVGKIVGAGGRMARVIRTLLGAVSSGMDHWFEFEVSE